MIVRILLLSLVSFTTAHAEVGVSDNTILVGKSIVAKAAHDEARVFDENFRAGIAAHIDRVNASGGVHGRKIKFVFHDDQYEPRLAAENTRKLIDVDKVFCLFGYFSSQAATAARPIYQAADVPFIAPFSGLDLLRKPIDKNTFTVRASSGDEAEALVKHAVETLKLKKIAILHREDAFGDSGKRGIVAALAKRDLKPHLIGSYKRAGEEVVDPAAKQIFASDADGVIMWVTADPVMKFLKLAQESGYKKPILGPTNIGIKAVPEKMGAASEGLYATLALPIISDKSDVPLVKKFLEDMKDKPGSIDTYAFEGYVNAIVFVEALKKAGRNLTRQTLREGFHALRDLDIGGVRVTYSPTDHQGLDQVFMAQVKDGKYQLLK